MNKFSFACTTFCRMEMFVRGLCDRVYLGISEWFIMILVLFSEFLCWFIFPRAFERELLARVNRERFLSLYWNLPITEKCELSRIFHPWKLAARFQNLGTKGTSIDLLAEIIKNQQLCGEQIFFYLSQFVFTVKF